MVVCNFLQQPYVKGFLRILGDTEHSFIRHKLEMAIVPYANPPYAPPNQWGAHDIPSQYTQGLTVPDFQELEHLLPHVDLTFSGLSVSSGFVFVVL